MGEKHAGNRERKEREGVNRREHTNERERKSARKSNTWERERKEREGVKGRECAQERGNNAQGRGRMGV